MIAALVPSIEVDLANPDLAASDSASPAPAPLPVAALHTPVAAVFVAVVAAS